MIAKVGAAADCRKQRNILLAASGLRKKEKNGVCSRLQYVG